MLATTSSAIRGSQLCLSSLLSCNFAVLSDPPNQGLFSVRQRWKYPLPIAKSGFRGIAQCRVAADPTYPDTPYSQHHSPLRSWYPLETVRYTALLMSALTCSTELRLLFITPNICQTFLIPTPTSRIVAYCRSEGSHRKLRIAASSRA